MSSNTTIKRTNKGYKRKKQAAMTMKLKGSDIYLNNHRILKDAKRLIPKVLVMLKNDFNKRLTIGDIARRFNISKEETKKIIKFVKTFVSIL